MKRLCKHCKFWDLYENTADYPSSRCQGECSCDSFIEHISIGVENPADSLVYWDFEGYLAGFSTGREFGCIHWREKT